MKSHKRVTVVIPCYNAARYLGAAIESALHQSHVPAEVLVIDDGSTDQSAVVAGSFGPPVRVILQSNRGESVARNRGIEEAQGDWIAFLDADDLWLPDKLARQLAVAGPDVVCVHTNYYTFGTRRKLFAFSDVPPAELYSLERFFLRRSPLGPSTIMVPKWLPARFPDWTQYAEDIVYFVEVARLGTIVLVPEFLTAVRCHRASQSTVPGIVARWHTTFDEWLRRNACELDPQMVQSLRRRMLEQLVHQAFRAHYEGNADAFRLLRDHLVHYDGDVAVQRLLHETLPPRWYYELRRGLGKLSAHWSRAA